MSKYTRSPRVVARCLTTAALLLATLSCGGGDGGTEPARVASIVISPAAPVAYVGRTVQLTATPHDAAGNTLADRGVTWRSADEGIATVDAATGLVTGVSVGVVGITAHIGESQKTVGVSVQAVPVAQVVVAAPTALASGERRTLSVTLLDDHGDTLRGRAISWQSENPSVATVDAVTGALEAHFPGSAVIIASSGNATGSATIVVQPAATGSLALACAEMIAIARGTTGTTTCTLTQSATARGPVTLAAPPFTRGLRATPVVGTVIASPGSSTVIPVGIEATTEAAMARDTARLYATQDGVTQSFDLPVDVGPSMPRVRAIYLVPSDRAQNDSAVAGIDRALRHLQIFYQNALGLGKTFAIASPSVTVLRTSHVASYYANNPNGASNLRYWNNALADAAALAGVRFNDPETIYLVYLDAEAPEGQLYGGTSGVALLPAHDVRGIAGQNAAAGRCRWVGGLGHEFGHAAGLPHPAGCDAGAADCPTSALMWLGYTTYPGAYFIPSERTLLEASSFFSSSVRVTSTPFPCSLGGAAVLASQQRDASAMVGAGICGGIGR